MAGEEAETKAQTCEKRCPWQLAQGCSLSLGKQTRRLTLRC